MPPIDPCTRAAERIYTDVTLEQSFGRISLNQQRRLSPIQLPMR